MSEWIENCCVNGRCKCLPVLHNIRVDPLEVDWGLFGQVLQTGIAILNAIAQIVFSLITVDGHNIYPNFGIDEIVDSEYVGSALSSGLS
jgi:hypothetical protein